MKRLVFVLLLTACGLPTPDDTKCLRGTLETDLDQTGPFTGPGVVDGAIPPGRYVIAATYLQGKPTQQAMSLFQSLVDPISRSLPTTEGLIGARFGNSNTCLTARTLSVWKDEASMYRFVTSASHATAMGKTSELSRGGSVTTHWADTELGATFDKAAQMLAADDGPLH